MNSTYLKNWPTCVTIPSKMGIISDCAKIPMPNLLTMTLALIISWILFMAIAYIIYYLLNKWNPRLQYNYWIILLILVLAGIIVALLSKLLR